MKTIININGQEVEITLTPEQVIQITKASKPKLFDYEDSNTWFIGSEVIGDGYDGKNTNSSKYGRYRRTQEQAEIDFKRQTRMMRLSALAWEVGECVEFTYGTSNYYIYYDYKDKTYYTGYDSMYYSPITVYMEMQTANKVCEMLNSDEYSLDI
jgi:hypothetical protein